MKRATLVSTSLFALGLALAACQLVAGVETRNPDPLLDGCTLPTSGAAKVRFANLVPNDSAVDVCIAPAGSGFGRPVLRGGGSQCPAGFKYTEVSAAFAAPSGSVDVKVISAGLPCSAPPLAQARVDVGTDAVVSLLRIGGGDVPESIVASSEAATIDGSKIRIRFLNALLTDKPLRLGLVDEARLPTKITSSAVAGTVAFGKGLAPGAAATIGEVDARGYLVTPATTFNLAAAEDGATNALLIANVPRSAATYSMFAVGNPKELAFSPRAVFCKDGDGTGVLETCSLTALPTLSVDTFNAGLYGANAPYEAQRRPKIFETLAARETDLACIVELARKEDRDAMIAAAAAGALDYAQTADTSLDSAPTDPKDATGAVPPAPPSPSCGGSVPTKLVDDVYSCVAKNCSSKPGDESGVLAGTTDCLSTNCLNEFIALRGGTADDVACYNCAIVNLISQSSIAQGKLACTTDARRPVAFGGQNPSLVLSRYPLVNQETFVLPSTGFRRTILYSQVQLQQGATIDFYCGQFSSTLNSSSLPYSGAYGGSDSTVGWEQEQALQAQQLIAYVKRKSGSRPAILAGDWHSATAVAADAGASGRLVELNPSTVALLRGTFTEAIPRGYAPACTYCEKAKNPYNEGLLDGYFLTPTFLTGFADGSTAEASIIYNQPVVSIPGGTGMLSEYFGYNVRVLRP